MLAINTNKNVWKTLLLANSNTLPSKSKEFYAASNHGAWERRKNDCRILKMLALSIPEFVSKYMGLGNWHS